MTEAELKARAPELAARAQEAREAAARLEQARKSKASEAELESRTREAQEAAARFEQLQTELANQVADTVKPSTSLVPNLPGLPAFNPLEFEVPGWLKWTAIGLGIAIVATPVVMIVGAPVLAWIAARASVKHAEKLAPVVAKHGDALLPVAPEFAPIVAGAKVITGLNEAGSTSASATAVPSTRVPPTEVPGVDVDDLRGALGRLPAQAGKLLGALRTVNFPALGAGASQPTIPQGPAPNLPSRVPGEQIIQAEGGAELIVPASQRPAASASTSAFGPADVDRALRWLRAQDRNMSAAEVAGALGWDPAKASSVLRAAVAGGRLGAYKAGPPAGSDLSGEERFKHVLTRPETTAEDAIAAMNGARPLGSTLLARRA